MRARTSRIFLLAFTFPCRQAVSFGSGSCHTHVRGACLQQYGHDPLLDPTGQTLGRRQLFGPQLLQGRGSAPRRHVYQGLALGWGVSRRSQPPGACGPDEWGRTLSLLRSGLVGWTSGGRHRRTLAEATEAAWEEATPWATPEDRSALRSQTLTASEWGAVFRLLSRPPFGVPRTGLKRRYTPAGFWAHHQPGT